jgi:hypothetical protein
MSGHMIELISFDARLKGNAIIITGYGPDDIEIPVQIEADDVREFYEMSVAAFLEKYGQNAKELCSLFTAMNGLKVIDND